MKHIRALQDAINHMFWSLVLQGIAFILLGIMIIIYPDLLIAIAATMFFVLGILLLALAAKIRAFWRKLPDFLK